MTANGLVAALVVFILVSFGSTFHGIFTYHEPFLVFPARLLNALDCHFSSGIGMEVVY